MHSQVQTVAAPKVRLIGRLEIDEEELRSFLADEGAEGWETDTDEVAQKVTEVAGRLCYKSYASPRPGGNRAYLRNILDKQHGSVLEHAVFQFIITGVSRSLTHELVRHRVGWSYSHRSQRFVDEAAGRFVVPPSLAEEVAAAQEFLKAWRTGDRDDRSSTILDSIRSGKIGSPRPLIEAGLIWLASVERAQSDYSLLSNYLTNRLAGPVGSFKPPDSEAAKLYRKSAREAARSILPNATETEIFVTVNARALRHFIELRGSEFADKEIRRLACCLLDLASKEAPDLFRYFTEIDNETNDRVIRPSESRKV